MNIFNLINEKYKRKYKFTGTFKAGFITGENICVDGGMTKLMVYHGFNGWKLEN